MVEDVFFFFVSFCFCTHDSQMKKNRETSCNIYFNTVILQQNVSQYNSAMYFILGQCTVHKVRLFYGPEYAFCQVC